MTWVAQVGHVMAKDLRQARWLVLVYLAVVAMATAHALEWPRVSGGLLDVSMFLVVIAGMFLVASFVQADSPVRSDAFWASRPFHPTAVLAAKVLLAVAVVMGPALLGQLAALAANGVSAAHLPRTLARSARADGLWLLIAMVVAGVTSDLRGFTTVLAAAAVSFGLLTLSTLFGEPGADGGAGASAFVRSVFPVLVAVGSVGGALGVLTWLYRRRGLRRRTWLAALGAVGCTFLSIFFVPPSPASPRSAAAERAAAERVAADVVFHVQVEEQGQAPARLVLHGERTRPLERLLLLDSGVVVLRLRGDTTLRMPLGNRIVFGRSTLPIDSTLGSMGGYVLAQRDLRRDIELTRAQREAVRAGIVQATVEGRVALVTPRATATLPFREGASARWEAGRAEVRGVNYADDDSLAVLSLSSIWPTLGGSSPAVLGLPPWDAPRYVLANAKRAEVIIADSPRSGTSSDMLVLPGVWREKGTAELRRISGRLGTALDSAWLSEAQLVIIDWAPEGWSPLRVTAVVGP